ncbi:MAG TPA: hypothetical protein GX734_06100 [Clostridiaceae bacterium]|nr:hypothetical protein [Clostridiaceae bacterium]
MSKRKHTVLLVVAGVFVLAAFAVLLFEFVLPGRRSITLPSLPGLASTAEEYDPDLLAPGIKKIVNEQLMTSITVKGEKIDGLLASSYETSMRRGFPGVKTAGFLASDQIRYGRALIRMNKRSEFFNWAEAFDLAFRPGEADFHAAALRSVAVDDMLIDHTQMTDDRSDKEGFDDLSDNGHEFDRSDDSTIDFLDEAEKIKFEHQGSAGECPDVFEPVDQHWSVTLSYTRALMEGYQKFGGRELERRIRKESDVLLPVFRDAKTDCELLAGPRMLLALDEWDDPIPGSTPTPGEEAPIERSPGTHLADIDLWAMSALARFEPAWASIASDWQKILENAVLESRLPLYASAYRSDTATYIAVTGGGVMSSTREQLEIVVHLAEVGVVYRDFLSFIRSALRDEKRLPSGWNPVTGNPSGQSATSSDYALALILGRVANDTLLIDSAREAMMRHYASSQTSDIFGGWYRAGSTSHTFRLVAEDNTAVLLALR